MLTIFLSPDLNIERKREDRMLIEVTLSAHCSCKATGSVWSDMGLVISPALPALWMRMNCWCLLESALAVHSVKTWWIEARSWRLADTVWTLTPGEEASMEDLVFSRPSTVLATRTRSVSTPVLQGILSHVVYLTSWPVPFISYLLQTILEQAEELSLCLVHG